MQKPLTLALTMVTLLAGPVAAWSSDKIMQPFIMASGAHGAAQSQDPAAEKKMSPEEKMSARYPQPVKVGDLVGLPVLDWYDRTIGFVREVVRTPDGKIQLIVPYGRWFGWLPVGGIFDWGRRPVAVPIEVVAILGRQIAALDMERPQFDAAPTWSMSQSQPIPAAEMIKIAINNR